MSRDVSAEPDLKSIRHHQIDKTRFINPFEGVGKALDLNGLFLFDPTVEMKLAGNPLRARYEAIGYCQVNLLKKCAEKFRREFSCICSISH